MNTAPDIKVDSLSKTGAYPSGANEGRLLALPENIRQGVEETVTELITAVMSSMIQAPVAITIKVFPQKLMCLSLFATSTLV